MIISLIGESEEGQSIQQEKETEVMKLWRQAKESLMQLFNLRVQHGTQKYLWMRCIWPLLRAWQLLSLIVPTESTLPDWAGYRILTHSFYYMRVDGLAAQFNVFTPFLAFVLVCIYALFACLCVLIVQGIRGKANRLLSLSFHYGLDLLTSVFFIGGMVSLSSVIRYSLIDIGSTHSAIYDDMEIDYQRNVTIAALAVASLPFLIALRAFACVVGYEIRYNKRKNNMISMPFSVVRFTEFCTEVIHIVLYVFVSNDSLWYLYACGLLYTRLLILYILRLPYYNPLSNWAHSLPSLLCSCASWAFLLSRVLDNAHVLFWLFIFVVPLLAALAADLMTRVRARADSADITQASSPAEVELHLRHLYELYESSNSQGKAAVEEKIHATFNFATRKFRYEGMIYVWEAEFYLTYIKDFNRALGKISKLSQCRANLEVSFHANKVLSRIAKENCEEQAYFLSQHTFDKAKRADKLLCQALMALCNELMSFFGHMDKLEMRAKRVHFLMNKAVNRYKGLYETANVTREALDMYAQLLESILQDPSSQHVLKHQRYREQEKQQDREDSIFSKRRGIFVLNLGIKSFGTIVHANALAFSKVAAKLTDVVGVHISKFLPGALADRHDVLCLKCIEYGKDYSLLSSLYRFLLSRSNRLLMLVPKCRMVLWKSDLYLVVDFLIRNCDAALVDTKMEIVTYSENMSVACGGMPTYSLSGLHIDKILPGCSNVLSTLEGDTQGRYEAEGKTLFLAERVSYGSEGVYVVMAVKGENAYASIWESTQISEHQQDISTRPQKKVEFHPNHAERKKTGKIDNKVSYSTLSASVSTINPHFVKRNKSIARLKATAKFLNVALLASMLTMAGFAIGVLLVILTLIQHMQDMSSASTLTSQLYYSVSLLEAARSLTLQTFQPDISATQLQAYMENDLSGFSSDLSDLQSWIQGLTGNHAQKYYLNELVPTFEPTSQGFRLDYRTMLDASLRIVAEASSFLAQSTPSISPQFLYLYRNAMGETLGYLNKTNFMYLSWEEGERTSSMGIVLYLLILWILLVAGSFTCLLVIVRWKVDQCKREVWEEFLARPMESLQAVRQAAIDRLNSQHGEETQIEDIHRRKASVKPKFSKIWPGIASRLSMYVVLSGVIIYVLFYWQYSKLTDLVMTMPWYMGIVVQRRALSLGAFYWFREEIVRQGNWSDSYFQVIKDFQPIRNPRIAFRNYTSTLSTFSSVLFNERKDYGIHYVRRSNIYDAFLFDNACSHVAITSCEATTFNKGLRRAMDDFVREMEDVLAQTNAAKWGQVSKLELLARHMDQGLKYVQDIYALDTSNQLSDFRSLFAAVTSVYCFAMAVLALCCYLPYINRAKRHILSLWTVLELFSPQTLSDNKTLY